MKYARLAGRIAAGLMVVGLSTTVCFLIAFQFVLGLAASHMEELADEPKSE
jgi:hypothetical protein